MSLSRKCHDVGAARFGWLLRQRQIDFVPQERLSEKVEILGGKQPDFYAWTPRVSFLAEVESFKKPGPTDGIKRGISISPDAMSDRLRTSVKHAARQLKPYEQLHIPLLVVLDNHRRAGIDTAVAVNFPKADFVGVEPVDQERPMRLRVLYNPYADSPFPEDLFTDAEDEHIRWSKDRWVCSKAE